MSKLAAVVAGVLALCAAAVAGQALWTLGSAGMDASGYIALVLGAVGTLGLAGGLLALIFYSHRHGYDDRAGAPLRPPEPPQAVDKTTKTR